MFSNVIKSINTQQKNAAIKKVSINNKANNLNFNTNGHSSEFK